jgi:hypothetical protein
MEAIILLSYHNLLTTGGTHHLVRSYASPIEKAGIAGHVFLHPNINYCGVIKIIQVSVDVWKLTHEYH